MASILEAIRLLHEEIEVLEKAGATVLDNKPSAQFGALFAEARVAAYTQRVRQLSSRLLSLYEDADAAKRVESATLSSAVHMTTFYERLGVIRSAPAGAAAVSGTALAAGAALGAASAGPSADTASVLGPIDSAVEVSLRRLFAPEEVLGRYIDLQAVGLFDSWANLPLIREARAAAATARAGGAAASGSADGSSAAGSSVAALMAGFRGAAASSQSGSSSAAPSATAAVSLPLGAATLDYPAFLSRLAELHTTLPAKVKLSRQYRRHVASLAGALLSFYARTHPMLDVREDLLAPIAQGFAARWADALTGRGPAPFGWATAMRAAASGVGAGAGDEADASAAGGGSVSNSNSSSSNSSSSSSRPAAPGDAAVDLTAFGSQADMEASLGAEGIRSALAALGMKVGGTPTDRAARLWSVRGLARDQIPKKLLVPASAAAAAAASSAASSAASASARPSSALASGAATAMDTDAADETGTSASAAAAPASAPAIAGGRGGAAATHLGAAVDAVFAVVDVHSYFAAHVAPAVTAAVQAALSAAAVPAPAPALPHWLSAAWCEEAALRGASLLRTELEASVRRLDRRATRTSEEWAAEREAEEAEALASAGLAAAGAAGAAGSDSAGVAAAGAGAGNGSMLPVIAAGGVRLDEGDDDDDDDGAAKYASNIVLGEDGKPLPYWLYRLHGLNILYPCEICGGESYRGRRAFDRHFQEWRHAYGMRCLGIPNTKHFHDITKIADALALWERLRTDTATESFRADVDEEFEDSAGNVLTRRTYEDLARQGML